MLDFQWPVLNYLQGRAQKMKLKYKLFLKQPHFGFKSPTDIKYIFSFRNAPFIGSNMKNLFCQLRSNKSKKSSLKSQKSNKNNVANGSITNTNSASTNSLPTSNQLVTNDATKTRVNTDPNAFQPKVSIYRYVTEEFQAKEADEISVFPGDLVIFEYADDSADGSWAHVLCTRNSKRGFLPNFILSTEPVRGVQYKKKIPRSQTDTHRNLHLTNFHRPQHQTAIGRLSSDSDNIHFHRHQHQHQIDMNSRFGVSHSLQSSSGNHSFQKYPDFKHLCSPTYYNIRNSDPHSECCEIDSKPFSREDLGLYVALHNFVAREENDVNLRTGESVTLLNKDDEDWFWVRKADGEEGFVPSNYICDYVHVKSFLDKGNSTVTSKSMIQNDSHTYMNHRPDRDSLATTDQQSSIFR